MRHTLTFKRYAALKKAWQVLPPVALTILGIAKYLGLEMAAPPPAQPVQNDEIYYDESYYTNTAGTPWRQGGGQRLAEEFQGAGGEIK